MNATDLLKINVNEHTERKGGLTYLSWAWAWAEALRADPAASFRIEMFGHEAQSPVCYVADTGMVFVSVTMFGKTLTCHLPIMDHRNKAIKNPDSFAVNTAIQRALTKGLALHGLGLYIYAGEDLPQDSADEVISIGDDNPKKAAFERLQPEIQDSLRAGARAVVAAMPDVPTAIEVARMVVDEWTDADEHDLKLGLWYLLDSKTRSAIDKVQKQARAA
jgi:hypothetical protein